MCLEDRNTTGSLLGDPLALTLGDLLPMLSEPPAALPSRAVIATLAKSVSSHSVVARHDPQSLAPEREVARVRSTEGFVAISSNFALGFVSDDVGDVLFIPTSLLAAQPVVPVNQNLPATSPRDDSGLFATVSSNAVPYRNSLAFDAVAERPILFGQNRITLAPPPRPNSSPVATNDSVSVNEDSSVLIDVLANDTDSDGDNLRVKIGDYVTLHGTVTPEAGKVRYTPFPDYHGSDAFTYRATDGVAASSLVTVSITVTPVNDAPMAYHDAFAWGLETDLDNNFTNLPTGWGNGPGYFAGNVLNNDIDFDWQDAITTPISPPGPPYSPPPPPSGKDTIFAVLDTQPAIGSVVNFAGNGNFYYMYPQGNLDETFQPFSTSFTYHVEDGKGGKSAPATANIWVKKGNYGINVESKDVPTFLVGDDPIEDAVPAGYTTVLTKAPWYGRMTQFEFDGKFKYTPRHDRTDQGFQYKLVDPGGITYTFVNVTLPMLQMDVYDGQGGAQSIREQNELNVGAFTVANRNDTDSDYVRDDVDGVVKGTPIAGWNTPHDGVDEVDLMKVRIYKPFSTAFLDWTLEVISPNGFGGHIYDNPYADLDSTTLFTRPLFPPSSKVSFSDASFRNPDNSYKASIDVWVGLNVESAALRDYTIELKMGSVSERAKATAVWSTLTQFRGTNANDAKILPNAGGNKDVQKYLDSLAAQSPVGKLGTANLPFVYDTNKTAISNPFELEFTLTPAGIGTANPRLAFDASRSTDLMHCEKLPGAAVNVLRQYGLPPNRDRANDDPAVPGVLDEVQIGDKFYSVDAPGLFQDRETPGQTEWYSWRLNALTFIRVKIGPNASITDLPLPAPQADPTPDLQGSRTSELISWRSWVTVTPIDPAPFWTRTLGAGTNEVVQGQPPRDLTT
jgi:hypothetical protein